MPRYFFHLKEGNEFIEDNEGVELASIAEANEEAIQAAREMMSEWVRCGQVIDGQEFLIFDDQGHQIRSIPFKSALHIE